MFFYTRTTEVQQEWEEVTVRLMCVDTEESQVPKGMSRHYKPITYGGKEADTWLKAHLGTNHDGRPKPDQPISVDIEFDTVEDTIIGCRRHNQARGAGRGGYSQLVFKMNHHKLNAVYS